MGGVVKIEERIAKKMKCRKKKYLDKASAIARLETSWGKDGKMIAYLCGVCGAWHLAHKKTRRERGKK